MRRPTNPTAAQNSSAFRHVRSDAGFTATEVAISVGITAVVTVAGVSAFRQHAESAAAREVAEQLAADVGLTRSFAIQRRTNVSMVLDESALTYTIRDALGTVLMRRDFGPVTETPLSSMTVNTGGDSLTFNARGLLVGGSASIVVQRGRRSHRVDVNVLGRTALD